MVEREVRLSPLSLAGDASLLLCALMGFTASFLSLYTNHGLGATPLDPCAAQTDLFLLLAAMFALVSLAVWSLPRFRWAAAGGLALLVGAAAALNWETVVQGAGITVRTITGIFSLRVSWGWAFHYAPGLTPSEAIAAARLFLVLALALLALILGWAAVRARRWWIVLLLTLPPLLPGLLADLYPDWPPFMALTACWCAMLLTDLCKWAAPSGRGRLTLAALGCCALALGGVTLAFPREGYTRPPWALEAETELHNTLNRYAGFFSRWEGPFQSATTYVGSAGEADLTRAGPLNYTGRTVLRVNTSYAGRMYLRGTSLAVYEDGVWTALPEGAYQDYLDLLKVYEDNAPSPLLFPALQGQQGTQYTVTVENVGAVGSCAYTPYYPDSQDWEALGMLPVEDAYFARLQGQRSFTMTFHDCYPVNGASLAEQAYHNLIREHYLDVPGQLRGTLEELCRQNGLFRGERIAGAAGGYDIILDFDAGRGINALPDPIEAARRVATVLDELCQYDPQAPAAPQGTDPVEYFLTESRRGYCMHYASAAALVLRSLGIPARYVSGFTADCRPEQQVSVPDRAAHAWVEIWLDGFGWYPVEVTPADAFAWYEQGDAQPSSAPSQEQAESQPPQPTPTPGPDASQAPSAPLPGEGDGPEEGSGGFGALKAVMAALAAVLGTVALLWLGQFLVKKRRAGKLDGPDRNRAALYAYGCLLRLERWGGTVDPRAVELAQKAKFSQHVLTPEELAELRRLADRERETLCARLGPIKGLAFRYLWGRPSGAKNRQNAEKSQENTP